MSCGSVTKIVKALISRHVFLGARFNTEVRISTEIQYVYTAILPPMVNQVFSYLCFYILTPDKGLRADRNTCGIR